MAGHHARDMLDRFLATLGVHAVVLPLFRSKRFVERNVSLPQGAELLQAHARIALAVTARFGPHILIKSLDWCARRSQNRAHSVAEDDFCIRQMRHNLSHRPLTWRWPLF